MITTYKTWTEMIVATRVTKPKQTNLDQATARVKQNIKRLEAIQREGYFLEVENANSDVRETMRNLEKELVALQAQKFGFLPIDPSFLSETGDSGLPKYLAINTTVERFSLYVEPFTTERKKPAGSSSRDADKIDYEKSNKTFFRGCVGTPLDKEYDDVIRHLLTRSAESYNWEEITIRADPVGVVLPLTVRKLADKARKFFRSIYVIYESPANWKINEDVEYSPKHALLVGVVNSLPFFVSSFDPIPLSDYLDIEFAKSRPRAKNTKKK